MIISYWHFKSVFKTQKDIWSQAFCENSWQLKAQKQPPELFFNKRCFLKISQNSQEKTCARVSFLIKLRASRHATLSKKRLWHRCFPVSSVKFLRTPFLHDTSERLLLKAVNYFRRKFHLRYLIGEKKPGCNFENRRKIFVTTQKLATFYTSQVKKKVYTPQLSQKALFIPLKFDFKNRKLINLQVNRFIKINVNVEVFFFLSTTVSVTNQFWLISRRKFPFFN